MAAPRQTDDGCSYLPSGEKETLCTEPLKWKWWSTDLHTKLTSRAAPPARGQSDTVAARSQAQPPDPRYSAPVYPRTWVAGTCAMKLNLTLGDALVPQSRRCRAAHTNIDYLHQR